MAYNNADMLKDKARFLSYVADANAGKSSPSVLQQQIDEINATVKKMNSDHASEFFYDVRIAAWQTFNSIRDKLQSAKDKIVAQPELDKKKAEVENTSKLTNTIIWVLVAIAIIVIIYFILKIKNSKS